MTPKRWLCVLLILWSAVTAQAQTTPCSAESGGNPVTLDTTARVIIQSIEGKSDVFRNPMLRFNVNASDSKKPLCVTLPIDSLLKLDSTFGQVQAGTQDYCDFLLASLAYSPDQTSTLAVNEIEIEAGASLVAIEVYAFCLQNNLPRVGSSLPFRPSDGILYDFKRDGGNIRDRLADLETDAEGFTALFARVASGTCGLGFTDLATQFAVFIQNISRRSQAFDDFYLKANSWVFARDYTKIYCLLGEEVPTSEAQLSINAQVFKVGTPIVLTNTSLGGIKRQTLTLTQPGEIIVDLPANASFRVGETLTLSPALVSQPGAYRATLTTFGTPLGFDEADTTVTETETSHTMPFVVESEAAPITLPTSQPLTERPFQQSTLASMLTWQQFLGLLISVPLLLVVILLLLYASGRTLKRVLVRRARLFLLTLSLIVALLSLAVIALQERGLL